MRAALALGLACALATAEPGELAAKWPGLDRAGKIDGLVRLSVRPSAAVLSRSSKWLDDPDPVVRGHVVRLVATCAADPALRPRAVAALASYVGKHLDWRARKEKEELDDVCRRFGREIPGADRIQAGANWKDPYDENARELPREIREERIHMREVIGAIQGLASPAIKRGLARVFAEHHDPEVVVRAVECFGAWKEWSALPAMADLLRIQHHGRAIGGGDVIGNENYATLRLKWDVHKDRLWWSRPEYVPRASRPIRKAASAIVGAGIDSARALDGWLLANEAMLRRHGVTLSAAFRARARSSQPVPER